MAQVKTTDYAKVFGKAAIELGDKAWKLWTPEVWQPLGIKDRTAQQRATSNGQGGTRSAMLAVMALGFDNMALASQAAAYVRNRYLGNTSVNTGGISYGWFTVYANLSTVASNATFKADSKGTFKLAQVTRKATPKASKPKAPSANGTVRVVRESDAKLAAMADIAATEVGA